jgi:hypothetical protein
MDERDGEVSAGPSIGERSGQREAESIDRVAQGDLEFQRWRQLTLAALERAEAEQAELHRQRVALDQQIARRQQEAEALRRAVSVVESAMRRDGPSRRGRAGSARLPATAVDPADLSTWTAVGKVERIRLWARTHDGVVVPDALYTGLSSTGVYRSAPAARGALASAFVVLTRNGELVRLPDGRYQLTTAARVADSAGQQHEQRNRPPAGG